MYRSPNARRVSRTFLSALFTLTLLVGGLAPLATQVEAHSHPKAKRRNRAAVAKRGMKLRRAARREERAEVGESERFNGPSAGEDGEDNVEQREEWFRLQRAYPFDAVPTDARRRAWESRPQGRLKSDDGRGILSVEATQWTPIGPFPTTPRFEGNWGKASGRINAIAVNPQNASVVLVGASTGGVWRSTDGGVTFTPPGNSQLDLSVGSIAFAPANPQRVYAGMGDLWGGYLGSGVLRSDDGGATWTHASDGSLPSTGLINNVRVDPADPNRVYATLYQYYDGNANGTFGVGGFYVSTNGGVTWQKTFNGLVRDVAISPANSQTIYAGTRRMDSNIDGVNSPGLYKSVNGGQTWARVYTSSFGAYTATTRIDMRVAVTPAAPQKVYILSGNTIGNSPSPVLAVSDDEGQTWGANQPVTGIDPGQYFYNIYMFAHPNDPNTLYVGTRDVFKSTNGGASWQSVTKNFYQSGGTWNYAPTGSAPYPNGSTSHPDQHSFAFDPNNPSIFYVGNDGGISKTTDGGNSFTSLNSTLSLAQFVGFAAHPTDPNFQIGGTQDNGTQVRSAANGWEEFAEGDGGHPVINPVDPRAVMSTYVRGSISRWQFNADGSRIGRPGKAFESTFGESATSPRIAFYPPFTGNGVDQTVYFGTWRLFVSQNFADTVNVTSPTWTSPAGTFDQTNGSGDVLSAIGVARTPYGTPGASTQVIYTGSAGGRVMCSTNGGATWTDRTSNLPVRFIETLTVADTDPSGATAYVTLGGFGSGHVFKTTDFGANWSDLGGSNAATMLPNTPTTALLVDPSDPNVLYAGTDIGVFRTISGGNAWETFNNGLPPVPVSGFAVSASGKIQIGTYGRGAYELQTTAGLSTIQFQSQIASVGEAATRATLNVTRAGDLSSTVSATVRTQDNPAAAPCDPTIKQPDGTPFPSGIAYARCDYATTVETLTFAPGEATKSFSVSIINDVFAEPDENVFISLANPSAGAQIGPIGSMTLRIVSDDASTPPAFANPILQTDFFVRQQYLDFFGREPDAAGFTAWRNTLLNCPDQFNTSATSPSANCDRVSVSTKFFRSTEFELKGRYVFNFYKVAFSRLPHYSEIIPDMASLTAPTDAEFFAKKAAFTNEFVQRQEFKSLYDPLTNQQFVGALMDKYGLQQITTPNPATPDDAATKIVLTRTDLINRLNSGTLTRAQALRAIANSNEVTAAEASSAFVAMQYFGYLRRDPEAGGYADWLNHLTVTHPGDFRSMVNGFMNSVEYRLRFGTP